MYVGAKNPVGKIKLHSVPALRFQIPGGIHGDVATAAVVANCIPLLLEARSGLRTSQDIPMRHFSGLFEARLRETVASAQRLTSGRMASMRRRFGNPGWSTLGCQA